MLDILVLSVNVVDAHEIVASIEDTFKGANCKDFIDKLVGINVAASMNLGIHKAVVCS